MVMEGLLMRKIIKNRAATAKTWKKHNLLFVESESTGPCDGKEQK